MKLWDISRALSDDLAPWPGDRPVHFERTKKIANGDVVNLGAISMSVHNGTHADARYHFDSSGETIESIPLATYFGSAVIVDLTDAVLGSKEVPEIGIEALQRDAGAITETSRLLIKTGGWPDSTIFPKRIPVIAPDVAQWLQARGAILLGVDLPSVDAINAKVLRNHHALAQAGIAIVESLDLSGIEPGIYKFAGFPLKIARGDGAPVRAVLWRD
jgi:arylformamidase